MSRVLSPKKEKEDEGLERTLRPKKWEEYVGQAKIKKNIKIIITAAQERKQTPDHLLFYGSSGLGKTTLAHLVAKQMEKPLRIISAPAVERAGDLAAILTNLSRGDVLFIDECHRINRSIEEYLYSAMEDYKLNLILGKGPMARTTELKLPPFTLIGATTKIALMSSPLRNRFGATFQLDFYNTKDIEKIIKRSANILKIEIDSGAVEIIAKCSRLNPRVANRLLKRVRDFAQVEGEGIITPKITKQALEFLEIDKKGLQPGDRRILKTIIQKFEGGPVGIQSIAAASSEEKDAVLSIYEPYLMQLGFIKRTSQGRIATKLAYKHLGIKYSSSEPKDNSRNSLI